MTEEDAKKRWCPFASTEATIGDAQQSAIAAVNRPVQYVVGPGFESSSILDLQKVMCLGTGCMAFRFEQARFYRETGLKVWSTHATEVGRVEMRDDPDAGYCARLVGRE